MSPGHWLRGGDSRDERDHCGFFWMLRLLSTCCVSTRTFSVGRQGGGEGTDRRQRRAGIASGHIGKMWSRVDALMRVALPGASPTRSSCRKPAPRLRGSLYRRLRDSGSKGMRNGPHPARGTAERGACGRDPARALGREVTRDITVSFRAPVSSTTVLGF